MLVANLPYNVATPLVCDLLDGVPAIERMLVMVQREVAERLASPPRRPGLRRGQREGRLLGVGRRRRRRAGVGVRAPPERRVGARRDRPPATACTCRPSRCSRSCARAFGQRRKMLRRSLAGVVTDGAVRRRRRQRDGPARGARPRRLGPADRGDAGVTTSPRAGQADADAARHRRARRRLPPHRRRDGHARPRRHADDRRVGGDGITVGGPYAAGVPTDDANLVAGRCGSPAAGPRCTSTSRSRTAAASAAARPTPRRSCAGPGSPTCERRRGSAPTSRSASSAGGPASRGIGEVVEPLAVRTAASSRSSCRRSTSARPPSTGRGTTSAGPTADGPNDLEPAALVVGARAGPLARPHRRAGRRRAGPRRQRGDVVRARRTRRRPRILAERGRWRRGRQDGAGDVSDYLRRWWRVRRSIFLCFFLRIRLRRFLISEPIRATLLGTALPSAGQATGRSPCPRDTVSRSDQSGVVQR